MKNKKIYIIIGILIICIIISIIILLPNKNNKTYKIHKNITSVEAKDNEKEIDDNIVLTTYEEYLKYFNTGNLTPTDFIGFNYALIKINYNPCSEENITPYKYNIKGNNITVYVSYDSICGLCAPDYIYYLLKVEKTITKANVNIEYELNNDSECPSDVAYKPIIYLYPKTTTNVSITLNNSRYLTTTYPKYNNGWNVIAKPDGSLLDKETNREYYGLYWEGNNHNVTMKEDGFIVEGKDTISFLEEKLKILGLTDREANEFIIYWLPKLEPNKYNYIRFETTEEINNYMKLTINPNPDSIIRILMDYKPLKKKIKIKEQNLITPKRYGFTVVEWGGSKIEEEK